MSFAPRLIVPVLVLMGLGMAAVFQGRSVVRVGYEISRLKSEIAQTGERNVQLSVQGSKLKSPKRVLELAQFLELKLAGDGEKSVPDVRAPKKPPAAPPAGGNKRDASR